MTLSRKVGIDRAALVWLPLGTLLLLAFAIPGVLAWPRRGWIGGLLMGVWCVAAIVGAVRSGVRRDGDDLVVTPFLARRRRVSLGSGQVTTVPALVAWLPALSLGRVVVDEGGRPAPIEPIIVIRRDEAGVRRAVESLRVAPALPH